MKEGTGVPADRGGKATASLDAFFSSMYERLLELFPEFATRTGDHRHDHRLADSSLAGRARYEAFIRASLDELRAIDPARLNLRRRTSRDLALLWLEGEVEGFQFDDHLLLHIDPLQGFQIAVPNLINDMPYATAEDYGRAIERIAGIPRYVEGTLEGTREGISRGAVQAREAVQKVLDQVEGQARMAPGEHPFFRPFEKFPPGLRGATAASLRAKALAVIEAEAIPALRRFAAHLREEYLPRSRQEAGIWAIPRGREVYAWLVRQSTTTHMTPEEIHRLGLSEVARIRGEMESVKAAAGFAATLDKFFGSLRTDHRFYFDRPEDLLAGYRDIGKRADAELPRFFGKLPRIPYGVLPVPDYAAPVAPAAYYLAPPADGSRAGFFYANTFDLPSRPRFEMEALTLHEAVPGHHLQLALQMEIRGLPEFQTRWLSFTAFIEGWGLYAERLGREMGFYADPYAEFGRLMYEMWRACRLVVDTGLHHLAWTREQAVDFLRENSSLTALNISSEVDRYIVWPSQALAYKIGELKILGLRRKAEAELRELFDIRTFHDRILEEGSLPLDILERRIEDWIRATLRRGARGG